MIAFVLVDLKFCVPTTAARGYAMDSAPVQSSSKCSGSDFSIKRILGEPAGGQAHHTPSPSWLCCTRYQPPRLPRSTNASGARARRSGRHARVPFTGAQAAALEAAYARAPYLAPPALRALAAALQLRDDRIKIWFQNRRARERREKNGNITPPKAVTLHPTTSTVSRVPALHHMHTVWSPFHSPLGASISTGYIHSNIDNIRHTTVSSDMTSAPTYSVTLCNKQAISSVSENSSSSGNMRCESPLDIETIDS